MKQRSRAQAEAPPNADLRQRLKGLTPAQADGVHRLMRCHAAGDRLGWVQWLLWLRSQVPDHPEVQLWQGLREQDEGRWADAAASFERVVALRPQDFDARCLLSSALNQCADAAAATAHLQAAEALARQPVQHLRLSLAWDAQGEHALALKAVLSFLQQEPTAPAGLLQRARCHKMLGHPTEAAADCRELIARGQELARAWFSLVDLKTVPLEAGELQALSQAAAAPGLPTNDRPLLQFAHGLALEQAGDWSRALAAFHEANTSVRRSRPWDREAFARQAADVKRAFDGSAQPCSLPQGGEVIFLIGLPRSGSTLVEQVLASHPQVEGASELPTLPQIIAAESRRRGRSFPEWVGQASAEDWARLGAQYLQATARWRQRRPIATDKLPDNWLYAAAIRAMLPQSKIIDCRRDAVETAWSCYKQLFGPGMALYSYDWSDLATTIGTCGHLVDHWAARWPQHLRVQSYEALVDDPPTQVRALLEFCGLPFDAACLSPHETERAIRTPSALQVRQPMRRGPSMSARYGSLLDPLREALSVAGS